MAKFSSECYELAFLYSEWLDADKGLMEVADEDETTHGDLVREFEAYMEELVHD